MSGGLDSQLAVRVLERAGRDCRHDPHGRAGLGREEHGERQENGRAERADRRQHVLKRTPDHKGEHYERELDEVIFHGG